jgi:nucleoside phosphorylase
MTHPHVLVLTALPVEYAATREALESLGVVLEPREQTTVVPYLEGTMPAATGKLSVCLARPTRMGAAATAPIAAALVQRLAPQCVAMSGVCAGNPSDVSLGDVIVAECAYTYDEGKRSATGFEGDHRQIPLTERWLRIAQDLSPEGLPTYGEPTEEAARMWLLEQLDIGSNPRKHPARPRYLSDEHWSQLVTALEAESVIKRKGRDFVITDRGHAVVATFQAYRIDSPSTLPYAIHVGPIASGNVVVKDGITWDMLKALGVRTVLGLDMEAAAIAQVAQRLAVPHWLVVKGVMDYADPNKDDRIKLFAARAGADVLLRLLQSVPFAEPAAATDDRRAGNEPSANIIGDVSGSHITISQHFGPTLL